MTVTSVHRDFAQFTSVQAWEIYFKRKLPTKQVLWEQANRRVDLIMAQISIPMDFANSVVVYRRYVLHCLKIMFVFCPKM